MFEDGYYEEREAYLERLSSDISADEIEEAVKDWLYDDESY